MRYLVFSNWYTRRGFYCVARCARVTCSLPEHADEADAASALPPDGAADDPPAAPGMPIEKYVFGVASLSAEMISKLELPDVASSMERGCMHVCGVVVTDLGGGASRVEVMADVDPADPGLVQLVDRHVRKHILYTADRINQEARRGTASVATVTAAAEAPDRIGGEDEVLGQAGEEEAGATPPPTA